MYLRISSSLKGLESAISSGGIVKPVKEKESPKLALEALLSAAPLLTSSSSSFIWLIWALLDFLMCVFFPPRPGDAPVSRRLDFLEMVPPPSTTPFAEWSLDAGDFRAATIDSTSWSDFVLTSDVFAFSIVTYCLPKRDGMKM